MATRNENGLLDALAASLQELEQMYLTYDFVRLPLSLGIKQDDIFTITLSDNRTYKGKAIELHPNPQLNSVYIKLERITNNEQ